jgi:hypothetical protein
MNYQKPQLDCIIPPMSLKRIEREEKNRWYEHIIKLKNEHGKRKNNRTIKGIFI